MGQKIDFSENRNIFMPNIQMKKSLLRAVQKVFEYPDYKNTAVNSAIANYFDISCDNVSITNGSMEAINLLVKVLESKNNLTLVKINLKTGRHHQIRVQFSNINHPLYGDQKYGIKDNKQLALYAYKLSFTNPVTKNNLTFIKYPKKVGIWKEFNMEGENNE